MSRARGRGRRRRTPEQAEHHASHLAGRLAWFDGNCPVCDGPIQRHVSQLVLRKGEWIHTSCASGADE